jgi:hypothetical protein
MRKHLREYAQTYALDEYVAYYNIVRCSEGTREVKNLYIDAKVAQ